MQEFLYAGISRHTLSLEIIGRLSQVSKGKLVPPPTILKLKTVSLFNYSMLNVRPALASSLVTSLSPMADAAV